MKDLFGRDKVREAIERIRMFEPVEGYYLADSGGKDSSTVLFLTKMAGDCKKIMGRWGDGEIGRNN